MDNDRCHSVSLMRTRLFGTDNEEIVDLASWLAHAPPEKGTAQWRDGYSAKEQAKSWLRSGAPAVPTELLEALAGLGLGEFDEVFGRPEHVTRLDDYGRGRQHDLFGCARHEGATRFVIGVEAKACEGFDGTVADRGADGPPSKKRARCNLLAAALFGRPVLDEHTGTVLDEDLGSHGYQLWTAAVGTIIEAQRRNVEDAVLLVQQFLPRNLTEAREHDARDWKLALSSNAAQVDAFVGALRNVSFTSQETAFVAPGTRLHVLKVESGLVGQGEAHFDSPSVGENSP